ncbi:MAG: subclass B3 metallo-beta-lactamase [Bryobacteraceae bacterium]
MRMFVLLLGAGISLAAAPPAGNAPFPPYHIMGNLYSVGAADITSFLVTTPAGHIIINSGYEDTVPIIRSGVEKLGFKMRDVKILLASHAHNDHVGGLATLKQLTGAQVMIMQGDAYEISTGGKGDFRFHNSWKPCKIDRILHDGDEVRLGGTTLVAHLTPGHTRGNTTWTMQADDGGRKYNVVIVGSTSINPGVVLVHNPKYPQIAEEYGRAFRTLRALPCDVFLASHAGVYDGAEKYRRLAAGEKPNPFIDPAGYKTYLDSSEQHYREQLAAERAQAAKTAR